jgi:hypothetical protein
LDPGFSFLLVDVNVSSHDDERGRLGVEEAAPDEPLVSFEGRRGVIHEGAGRVKGRLGLGRLGARCVVTAGRVRKRLSHPFGSLEESLRPV